MKGGDSIGVNHRHEMSPADELGRCYPERVDVLQGFSFHATAYCATAVIQTQSRERTHQMNRRTETCVAK